MYRGSCLCGGVSFQINAELAPIQMCHCSQCRKAQGGAFGTNTPVHTEHFVLHSGSELLTEYESSPGKRRVFCRRCGSPLYSSRDTLAGVIRIRAGLLDEPLKVKPAYHFYTASKCSWFPITDDLPQFPEAAQ